jgi:hypothetical protein
LSISSDTGTRSTSQRGAAKESKKDETRRETDEVNGLSNGREKKAARSAEGKDALSLTTDRAVAERLRVQIRTIRYNQDELTAAVTRASQTLRQLRRLLAQVEERLCRQIVGELGPDWTGRRRA